MCVCVCVCVCACASAHVLVNIFGYPKVEGTKALGPGRFFFKVAATAAKSPQSCPTLCDPIDGAHQAPPSLGFSRQEHWSGLPFPSPMQESEK